MKTEVFTKRMNEQMYNDFSNFFLKRKKKYLKYNHTFSCLDGDFVIPENCCVENIFLEPYDEDVRLVEIEVLVKEPNE